MVIVVAMLAEEFKERGVAEIFFEISACGQILGINLRNGQAMAAKVAGEFEEGDVLFAHGITNADGGEAAAGEADDGAARAAKLALERMGLVGRDVEVLLEEAFEYVGQSCLP